MSCSSLPTMRATVVLPVPGLPRKSMWWLGFSEGGGGFPSFSQASRYRSCLIILAQRLFTRSLTSLMPTSLSSSAIAAAAAAWMLSSVRGAGEGGGAPLLEPARPPAAEARPLPRPLLLPCRRSGADFVRSAGAAGGVGSVYDFPAPPVTVKWFVCDRERVLPTAGTAIVAFAELQTLALLMPWHVLSPWAL